MLKRKEVWKSEELAVFSQQLHQLLSSGIPLMPSLELLFDQKVISNRVGGGLVQALNRGVSFSQALKQEGFPDLFISFIRAAEEHGDYVFGLKQCESYYHARAKLVQEMVQACTYPLIVLCCVGAALTFMMTVVLPRFAELYQSMGVELPVMTRYILALTEVIQVVIWLGAGLLLFGVLVWLSIHLGSEKYRIKWERLYFSLPLVNRITRYHLTHYVSIQLGSLLRSGVPLLTSLELMERLSPWYMLREGVGRIKEQIITGLPLHHSMKSVTPALFLHSLPKMVALGEASGFLDQALLSLAQSTEVLMRNQLQRWIRGLEPILIFSLGIFIAITVVAMFLPMLQMVQAV